MNKVTIIVGPQGSGKTEKAKELAAGKNMIWITGNIDNPFCFRNATEQTELIVIDEITNDAGGNLASLIKNEFLTVKHPSKPDCEIQRPELIVCCQYFWDVLRRSHLEIIKLKKPSSK